LNITHATYDFLGLLPCADSLAVRGRRLHDTAIQRQSKTYAPDVLIRVDVEDVPHRLLVDYVDDGPLYLAQGETRELQLRLANEGTSEISEMWMLAGSDILVWIQSQHDENAGRLPSTNISSITDYP
jgi:trafficking protein particle complex subunit 8